MAKMYISGGPPQRGAVVEVGSMVAVGRLTVETGFSMVGVEIDVLELDVEKGKVAVWVSVGSGSLGVLVGSSNPGPRGAVNCCFAFG